MADHNAGMLEETRQDLADVDYQVVHCYSLLMDPIKLEEER